MIDLEKVIKGLTIERECVSRDCDRDCAKCDIVQDREWLLSVYDDALELLKEQEAEQPIVHENSYGWKFYYCPKCKQEFYQNRKQAYCDKCGKAVKWDADD